MQTNTSLIIKEIRGRMVQEFNGFFKTTSINRIRKMRKRIKVIPGGTSAGKTFAILPILINKAAKFPNQEISVVSATVPHLRKGAIKDFLKIMRATNRFNKTRWNKTNLTYTFENGSYIEFFSVEDEGRVRGPRRNILYVNEATNISWEVFYQLLIRTDGNIYIDYNPSSRFWVNEQLNEADNDDVEWLTLTYLDNEALPDTIIHELEKSRAKGFFNPHLPVEKLFDEANIKDNYWANWWRVYGLGMVGALEGVVFSNWTEIDEVPRGADLIGVGIDFGYTNDPTAIVAIYEYNGEPIWDEIAYEVDLRAKHIAKYLKDAGFGSSTTMVADCADPRLIDDINDFGFNIMKPSKPLIEYRIEVMQRQPFRVTKRSKNIKFELENYTWAVTKTGEKLNVPIDKFNHALDGAGYMVVYHKDKPRIGRARRM